MEDPFQKGIVSIVQFVLNARVQLLLMVSLATNPSIWLSLLFNSYRYTTIIISIYRTSIETLISLPNHLSFFGQS